MIQNPYQSPNAVPTDAKAAKQPFRLSGTEIFILVLIGLVFVSILLPPVNSAPRRRAPPTSTNVAPR